jgi:hypothetical protein
VTSESPLPKIASIINVYFYRNMTIPEPWDEKNNCFIYTNPGISDMLTEDQREQMACVAPDYTTFIRSNLSITDGSSITIPNVYEAIVTTYDIMKTLLYDINSINSTISTINSEIASVKSQISTINSEIASIKEQISALTPRQT